MKPQNAEKWGREEARERYGGLDKPRPGFSEDNKPQKLGDRNNMQASDYDNDVKGEWLRKDGQAKPGYAPSFRSPPGKPGFEGARSIADQGHKLRDNRKV